MGIAAGNFEPFGQVAGGPFDRDYQKLNFGDNEDLLEELLGMFRVRARESIEAILSAHQSGDIPSVLAVVHSLKGNAALVGAREVTPIALAIESAARENRMHNLPDLLQLLVKKVNAAIVACSSTGLA